MSDIIENSVNSVSSPTREVSSPTKDAALNSTPNTNLNLGSPVPNSQQSGRTSIGGPSSTNKVTTSRQMALQIRRDKEEKERLARTPPPAPRTQKKDSAIKLNPDGTVSSSPAPSGSAKKKKKKKPASKAVKSPSLAAASTGSKKKLSGSGSGSAAKSSKPRDNTGGVLGGIVGSPMSKAKRIKKKADLAIQMTAIRGKLDSLRKEKARLETKIASDLDGLKYPVKDEDLPRVVELKVTGTKKADVADAPGSPSGAALKPQHPYPLPLPIPSDVSVLPEGTAASAGTTDADSVSRILYTWSFLTMFNKQLAINMLTLQEYTDLLLYTAKPSVALSEIVSALLRLILGDPAISSKLNAHISNINAGNSEGATEGTSAAPMSDRYSGYSLMPRKLKPAVVTSLTWQVVLRCVLRSVSAVRQAKRSLEEVSASVQAADVDVAARAAHGAASGASLVTPMMSRSHAVAHLYTANLQQAVGGAAASVGVVLKDKDAQCGISADVQGFHSSVMRVLQELEGRDLHSFSLADKLLVLDVLIATCNDTARILDLLANHAEERQQKLLAISKQQQDEKQTQKDPRFKLRDYSDADRALAVEQCRIINMEANVAKNASNSDDKSGSEGGAKKKQKTNSGEGKSTGAEVAEEEAKKPAKSDGAPGELSAAVYIDGVRRLMQTCLTNAANAVAAKDKDKNKDKSKDKKEPESGGVVKSPSSAGLSKSASSASIASLDSAPAVTGKALRAALRDIRDVHVAPAAQVVQELDDMIMLRKLGIHICITSPATLQYRRELGIDLNNTRVPPSSPVDGSCGLESATNPSKGGAKGKSSGLGQRRSRDAMESKGDDDAEETVFTDKQGVPMDEYPSDDEGFAGAEEELLAFMDRNQKSQMRQKASQMQNERREKQRRRAELDSLTEQRLTADYYLSNAVESRNEKDIKSAIKFAKSWGLQGTIEATGEVYCTRLLKEAYRVKQELEAEAREEKRQYENEKALNEFFVRVEPVGTDRYQRRYFVFANDDRLWVEETVDDLLPDREKVIAEAAAAEAAANMIAPSTPDRSSTPAEADSMAVVAPAAAEVMEVDSSAAAGASAVVDLETFKRTQAEKELDLQRIAAAAIDKLKMSKPAAKHSRWSVYGSRFAIYKLYDALDVRGERERALKSALKSIFDLNEPPLDFLTSGNELIGRRIRRVFGGKNRKPVFGVITGWLPKDGSDPALWHVVFDDDEEDLEEDEVEEFIVSLEKEASLITPEQASCLEKLLQVQHASQNNDPSAPAVAATLASVNALAWVGSISGGDDTAGGGDDEEATFDTSGASAVAPEIVSAFHNSCRGVAAYKKNSIGVEGLKIDLLYESNMLADGIKKYYLANEFSPCTTSSGAATAANKAYSREDRRQWESGVRSAVSLLELKLLLLDLEKVVHDKVQDCPDVVKTEETERQKQLEREEMVEDGWVFDPSVPCLAVSETETAADGGPSSSSETADVSSPMDYASMINKRVRRHFRGFGISDGIVTAYLPPARSEDGGVGFHVVHDDGDEEDLDLPMVLVGLEALEGNWTAEDDRLPAVGEANEDEEGADDDMSDSSSVAEDEEDEATGGSDSERHTLWPNTTVRNKWMQSVEGTQLVGEVGLALNILIEYCRNFGVIGANPLEDTWGNKAATSVEMASQLHLWCTSHNVLKPSAPTPKKSLPRSSSSGSVSGVPAAVSSKRRHSVSKKMSQHHHSSRSVRSSRISVSYAGMD